MSKIAVVNFSGNVGKTSVSVDFLSPRMGNPPIFSIESINLGADATALNVEQMKGKKFGDLIAKLMPLKSAIVDVGASNVEDFVRLMQQNEGAHEEFHFFVVPTIKEKKAITDTINTIDALNKIGVPMEKIRLVFNKIDADDLVEDEFGSLFAHAANTKAFIISEHAVIYSNEVFEKLKELGKTLADIGADKTDYRARFDVTTDAEEKTKCLRMVSAGRLAITANRNLDAVFKVLFAEVEAAEVEI